MTPEIRERLLEIAEENAESLYSDFGAEGLWVTEDKLPSEPSEFKEKEYEALLSPERLEEIRNGHPPTEAELRRLREERLANILRGNHDAESVPAYCLAEVVDEQEDDDIGSGMINTGIAVILCTGTSFEGVEIWVQDVYDSKEEALAYLNRTGWTS